MPIPKTAFILGAPRSGTTLLRVMLAGHPALFSPPEMVLAPFDTMAQRKALLAKRFWEKGGLRRALMDLLDLDVPSAKAAVAALDGKTVPEVYTWLHERLGGRVLVDKCPHLGAYPAALARLEGWFDDLRYVWIVRNPGSVTRSIENMPMAEVMLQGYAEDAREIWRAANQTIADHLAKIPEDRWVMVRYEALVTDPRPELERACAAIGVPFHDALLDPYQGDRMREGPSGARAIGDPNMAGHGRIKPELATKWLDGFDHRKASAATKALALELGYDLEQIPLPPLAAVTDAMNSLWDRARELEDQIRLPMDIDATEGHRFLIRMLNASLDMMVEQNDPDHPSFDHTEGPHRKMFADCPDTDYLRAPIRTDEGRVYRVWGRIPEGTTYCGVLLYRRGGRVGNRLVDTALQPDADGNFELFVGADPTGDGVWLRADGDETGLMVRQYYVDRATERPIDVHIELVGHAAPPPPLDARDLAKRLVRADRMLQATFTRTMAALNMAHGAAHLNFIPIGAEDLFPTPDNEYQVAWYRFGWNQVLVIRGSHLPKSRYFSFTLYNAWLESYDYEHRTVHRNHAGITTNEDGSFEIVLAHQDPGHPNWLDTAGHHAGYVAARTLLGEGPPPRLDIQVMYESELQAQGSRTS